MLDQIYYDEGEDVKESFLESSTATRKLPPRSLSWKVTLHLLQWTLICVLGLLALALYTQLRAMNAEAAGRVYSPAQHVVRSQNVVFSNGFGRGRTEYMGEPSPANEAAWSDLYNFGISRIPQSSAAQLVNKTVPIPDDPGHYAISLDVFHQLHCLNMVRKRLYSKQAYGREDELMGMDHIEHCIDTIRQSLMCASDITPLPWTWVEADQEAKEVADVIHTCRNFEDIRTWGRENRAKHFDRHTYAHDPLRD